MFHKKTTTPPGSLPEWRFLLDEEKKEQSLSVIRLEVSRKRLRRYPSFVEQIINQLRFRSGKYWLLQGVLLLAAMFLALALHKRRTGSAETLAACSVFLVFAGNICLSRVAGLFSWHMAELEQTLYLNLKQMVCIRMLEAGIADLIILAVFLAAADGKNSAGIIISLTYMLVPFLWSDIFYLHMLAGLRNTSSVFRSFTLGLLCGIPALFPILWESIYSPEYLIIWQILAIAGIFMFAAEIRRLLSSIENGDSICLN